MPVVRGEPVNRAGAARAVKLASLHAAIDARAARGRNPENTGPTTLKPLHYTPSRNVVNIPSPLPKQPADRIVSASYAKNHDVLTYRDKQGNLRAAPRSGGIAMPGTGLIAQGLSGLAQDAIYHPAGVYDALTHPLRTGKAVAGSAAHLATHPWEDPVMTSLALYGGGNALANLPERVAAARVGGVGKLLQRPVGGSRVLHHDGKETLALNSDAPLARPMQRLLDRAGGIHKATPDPTGKLSALAQLRADYGAHRFRVHDERASRLTRAVADAKASDNSFDARLLGKSHEPVVAPGSSQSAAGRNGRAIGNVGMQAVRTVNRASRAAVLYKPGYLLPNLGGQEFLSLTDQGLLAPAQRLRQGHGGFRGSLGDIGNARLNALAGSGIIRSSETAAGRGLPGLTHIERGVDKVDRAVGGAAGSILDTPYRRAGVVHQLRRRGFKGPEQTKQALADLAQFSREHPGRVPGTVTHPSNEFPGALSREKNARKALEAGLGGNQAMINYDALGPVSKAARDFVFFTPWLKGSALYAGHYLRDHPLQALLAAQLGKEGYKRANRELGPEPSFAQGTFKVGERTVKGLGRVPMTVNPQSASILGQPAQLAQSGAAMLGLTPNKPGLDPENYLSPFWYSLQAALTHKDPFTGHAIPQSQGYPEIFGHQFANMISPYSMLWKGGALEAVGGPKPKSETNPTQVLKPRTAWDAFKQWTFGSVAPAPENPVVQQSRVRSEDTAATSKEGAVKLRTDWYKSDLGNRMAINHFGKLTPQVDRGISWQRDLMLQRLRVAKMGGNAVGSHGSLTSVGSLAAQFRTFATRNGVDPARTERVTKRILAVDPQNTDKVKLVKQALSFLASMPGPAAAKQLRALTKQLNQLDHVKHPYAQGGSAISFPGR